MDQTTPSLTDLPDDVLARIASQVSSGTAREMDRGLAPIDTLGTTNRQLRLATVTAYQMGEELEGGRVQPIVLPRTLEEFARKRNKYFNVMGMKAANILASEDALYRFQHLFAVMLRTFYHYTTFWVEFVDPVMIDNGEELHVVANIHELPENDDDMLEVLDEDYPDYQAMLGEVATRKALASQVANILLSEEWRPELRKILSNSRPDYLAALLAQVVGLDDGSEGVLGPVTDPLNKELAMNTLESNFILDADLDERQEENARRDAELIMEHAVTEYQLDKMILLAMDMYGPRVTRLMFYSLGAVPHFRDLWDRMELKASDFAREVAAAGGPDHISGVPKMHKDNVVQLALMHRNARFWAELGPDLGLDADDAEPSLPDWLLLALTATIQADARNNPTKFAQLMGSPGLLSAMTNVVQPTLNNSVDNMRHLSRRSVIQTVLDLAGELPAGTELPQRTALALRMYQQEVLADLRDILQEWITHADNYAFYTRAAQDAASSDEAETAQQAAATALQQVVATEEQLNALLQLRGIGIRDILRSSYAHEIRWQRGGPTPGVLVRRRSMYDLYKIVLCGYERDGRTSNTDTLRSLFDQQLRYPRLLQILRSAPVDVIDMGEILYAKASRMCEAVFVPRAWDHLVRWTTFCYENNNYQATMQNKFSYHVYSRAIVKLLSGCTQGNMLPPAQPPMMPGFWLQELARNQLLLYALLADDHQPMVRRFVRIHANLLQQILALETVSPDSRVAKAIRLWLQNIQPQQQ